jgi:hypothetical protein
VRETKDSATAIREILNKFYPPSVVITVLILSTYILPSLPSGRLKSDCGTLVPRINVENGIKMGFLLE